jgi:hypothetical protein
MNNRELATLILAALIAVAIAAFATRDRGARKSLRGVFAALFAPKVIGPILGFGAWVFALTALAKKVGLWDDGLIFPVALWTVTAGLGLIFKLASRKSGELFFRPMIARTFRLTVFVEIIVGLYAFSLGIEIVLLVVASFLGMLSAVADSDKKYEPVKKLLDGLIGFIGLAIIVLTVVNFASGWSELDKEHVLRLLILPLWLTLGAIPYLYLLALWIGYEHAFLRINLASDDGSSRRRSKLVLISALHGRAAKAHAFGGGWAREITESSGYVEAWRVGRRFLGAEKRRADEKQEAAERLKAYAGVDGVDEEGRRLDQREFAETKKTLQWLATMQMGWHRNRGGRYRLELLDLLKADRLPEEHDIHLTVAPDGQSWWAWRRTVTGWCFAIGAAEGPPDQWLYDGSEPPAGFPGDDPAWGERYGIEMKNW